MSELEAAIAAEMKRQGCERYDFDSDIPEVSSETTCEQHEAVWDEDRDACPIVASAVRAGWNAAINTAAEKAHNEGMRAFNASIKHEPGSHAATRCIGGMGASFVIRYAITSLLSDKEGPTP